MDLKQLCIDVISSRAAKFGHKLTDFMEANGLKTLEDATAEQLFDFAWNTTYCYEARRQEAIFNKMVKMEVPRRKHVPYTPEEKRMRDRASRHLSYYRNHEIELEHKRAYRARRKAKLCQDTQTQT